MSTRSGLPSLPDRCVFCHDAADASRICPACRRWLPWIKDGCEHCGRPMPAAQPVGVTCSVCQVRPPVFSRARAPFTYEFPIDAALKAIKFRRQLWYVPAFAPLLANLLEDAFPQADALAPVPLHRWRHFRRGFNQAAELCRPLARATGLPVLKCLRRTRNTAPQAGLPAPDRRKNLKNAFAVAGRLGCTQPVIVDDVLTTGETCEQLARALARAGVTEVGVLTVARV